MRTKHAQAEATVGEMHPAPRRTRWCLDSLPEGELGEFRPTVKTTPTLIWVCLYVYELLLLSLSCISGTSHLRQLVECLHQLNDWKTFGLYLNIPYWKLESIEIDHRRLADCRMAMLQHWLCTGTANKQALLLALRKMD